MPLRGCFSRSRRLRRVGTRERPRSALVWWPPAQPRGSGPNRPAVAQHVGYCCASVPAPSGCPLVQTYIHCKLVTRGHGALHAQQYDVQQLRKAAGRRQTLTSMLLLERVILTTRNCVGPRVQSAVDKRYVIFCRQSYQTIQTRRAAASKALTFKT